MIFSGYISTRVLRLREVGTHPQRQGNDSSPANEKFLPYDRRWRRKNVSQQHTSLKLLIFRARGVQILAVITLSFVRELPCAAARHILTVIPLTLVARFASFVQRGEKCAEKSGPKCVLRHRLKLAVLCDAVSTRGTDAVHLSDLTGVDEVRRWDEDCSQPQISPPSAHPGAIWRSSTPLCCGCRPSLFLRSPAGCRSAASPQTRVRGPAGDSEGPHSKNQDTFILVERTFLLMVDFPLLGCEYRTT